MSSNLSPTVALFLLSTGCYASRSVLVPSKWILFYHDDVDIRLQTLSNVKIIKNIWVNNFSH